MRELPHSRHLPAWSVIAVLAASGLLFIGTHLFGNNVEANINGGFVQSFGTQSGIVATVSPYATSYARLAPGLLNSPEEVDQVLAAVRSLA